MKILIDHSSPFALAHGGLQTQIEQTRAGLERRGLEVDFTRWWDARQKGDLIHYFGVPSLAYLAMAREKKIPVAVTNLFTATCNRSPRQLQMQGAITRSLLALPGWGMVKNQLTWESFRQAGRMIVGLEAEKRVLQTVFGLSGEAISVVPLGLDQAFLAAGVGSRSEPHLITTGTITPRKRCVELAHLARKARVPVLFVGKPYHPDDPYWREFAALIDDRFVLHRDHVAEQADMIALLRASRGFVIYSRYENWCLSAHEALACGLPVLVPDQPWSRECFGDKARYLDAEGKGNVERLRAFYEESAKMSAPTVRLFSWDEVAERLEGIYRGMLAGVLRKESSS